MKKIFAVLALTVLSALAVAQPPVLQLPTTITCSVGYERYQFSLEWMGSARFYVEGNADVTSSVGKTERHVTGGYARSKGTAVEYFLTFPGRVVKPNFVIVFGFQERTTRAATFYPYGTGDSSAKTEITCAQSF